MPRAPQVHVQPAARGSERSATVKWSQLAAEPEVSLTATYDPRGVPLLNVRATPGVRVDVGSRHDGEGRLEAAAPRFAEIRVDGAKFFGVEFHDGLAGGVNFGARWDLFLIREAWEHGLDLEALADGYGPGAGTHGDWSGIRDSSPEAVTRMTEAALNFLFPRSR